jgi:hypothetical protein
MTDDDKLGIYYKCLRGMNSHFGLSEPHSFTVNDAAGRDWICYPVPKDVVQNLDLLSDLVDVERADEKSDEETVVRLVFCQDGTDLTAILADESEKHTEDD